MYSRWDRTSKDLPKIRAFTTKIEAIPDNEFGMIVNIKGARGKWIDYCIEHPPFKDENGHVAPDFTGNYRIETKDYNFFIGDCIWEPVKDKVGIWTIKLLFEDQLIMDKKFEIIVPSNNNTCMKH